MNRIISRNIVVGLIALFGLSACQDNAVKRDAPAPEVSDKFKVSGHIEAESTVEDEISNSTQIPSLVKSQIPSLPP